jgi:hypothetical protein
MTPTWESLQRIFDRVAATAAGRERVAWDVVDQSGARIDRSRARRVDDPDRRSWASIAKPPNTRG